MSQKAANSLRKVITEHKAVVEARSRVVTSKASEEAPKRQHSSIKSCVPDPSSQSQVISTTSQIKQTLVDAPTKQTTYLLKTIEPLLDAATWYPGPLSFDISLGLLLLHSSPNAATKKFLSSDGLKDYLKKGLTSPSCRFFDRLTTLPADVDHIINLEVNNCRLFDERPEEQNFHYEFHCSLGAEHFLVVIDQSHKITISNPPAHIGSVHLNVPGSIWDASLAIHGAVKHFTADSKEVKEAAEDIVRNMFVERGRTHIRLVLKTAKGLKITKVILQRTTVHRHIRPKSVDSCGNGPYMYLRVKETQDLIISANCLDDVMTAHCASRKEMVEAKRQWWSVSLISPVLDATLQRNSMVEPGDKTTEWKPKCLFGDDAEHMWQPESSEPLPELLFASARPDTSNKAAISSSTWCAGLGSLVRLAETVVKNINSVGANNAGPGVNIDRRINSDGDGSNAMGKLSSRKIVVKHRGLVTGKKTVFW